LKGSGLSASSSTSYHRIPIEDSIGALVDLQREGKIRHIGVSNVSERELARARAVASIVSV
jgi:aryl-alcohol dehydrogenase-like predicted oxidoreductase